MGMNRKKTEEYIKNQYGIEPDFPWDGDFVTAVFRHKDNRKWFALIMRVSGDRLGLDTDEPVDCMNLKIDDPMLLDMLIHEKGIIPAYHMNKQHWITVFLDGTVKDKKVTDLIDLSYSVTAGKKKRR
ncbi:Predicted DNA-binding protein, MmcQ/YjbR family [Ruminococcaceae bacterium YAD3003]|nr:Predicted DNA-binding protein, MmcQ/YjbR family [Ruminococcaceae bacterium YAD3003]